MKEQVLVIDDERPVLGFVKAALTACGYRVVISDRGDKAVEVFRALSPRPDIVLLDVVMPGLSGPMIAERIREIDPLVPILFMSGFDDGRVVQRFVVNEGFSLLVKPLSVNDLQMSVQASLEAARHSPATEFFA